MFASVFQGFVPSLPPSLSLSFISFQFSVQKGRAAACSRIGSERSGAERLPFVRSFVRWWFVLEAGRGPGDRPTGAEPGRKKTRKKATAKLLFRVSCSCANNQQPPNSPQSHNPNVALIEAPPPLLLRSTTNAFYSVYSRTQYYRLVSLYKVSSYCQYYLFWNNARCRCTFGTAAFKRGIRRCSTSEGIVLRKPQLK